MKEKIYQTLKLKILFLDEEDILTASGGDSNSNTSDGELEWDWL